MSNGKFQGVYVQDLKTALVASATSGVHCMVMSPPGYGKTTIETLMAHKMFGEPHTVYIEFEPTTEPERVVGHHDIAALLSDPPVNRLITDGTINDPKARVVICDEFFRAMDSAFDPVLHAMNRFSLMGDLSPVVWGTSNFSSTTERTEALRDRFGLWVWLPRENLDWKAVVMNQMKGFGQTLGIGDGLPDWDDIKDIRAARPGPAAMDAIAKVVVQLAGEAQQGYTDDTGRAVAKFDMNPRRSNQWKDILFRMGYWITQDSDFSEVPSEARQCLRWAYPLTDDRQARAWGTICDAVADPIDVAIQGMKTKAYQAFKKVQDEGLSKQAAIQKFGKVLSESNRELAELQAELNLDEDERITEAIAEVQNAYARVARGEDPLS